MEGFSIPIEWGLLGLALSAFLSATLLPGSSEVLLLFLANQGDIDWRLLLIVASIANTLGGVATFAMGFWAERGLVNSERIKPPSQKFLGWVQYFGYPAVFFSWLPVVGDGFCLAAGWLQMRWLPVTVVMILGKTARYWIILQVIDY